MLDCFPLVRTWADDQDLGQAARCQGRTKNSICWRPESWHVAMATAIQDTPFHDYFRFYLLAFLLISPSFSIYSFSGYCPSKFLLLLLVSFWFLLLFSFFFLISSPSPASFFYVCHYFCCCYKFLFPELFFDLDLLNSQLVGPNYLLLTHSWT